MDDSSLFMQWAVDTQQQYDHPPAGAAYHAGGGDAFPSLEELRSSASQNGTAPTGIAEQDGHRHGATNSWSSADTDSAGGGVGGNTSAAVVEHDGWSSNSFQCAPSSSVGSGTPVSWIFASAVAQPSNETSEQSRTRDGSGAVPYGSPRARKGHTSPKPYAQDHIMAERKRREKINRRFIELSTVIPGLKKMDKATILSDAVRYVKEQQEKLKALEDRTGRSIESVLLVKKPCIAAAPDDGGSPSSSAAGTTRNELPEIEARISKSSVMVRIHCENSKGVLVRLLAEVEGIHLSITHTNVIPFPVSTAIITVMAKVEKGFSITAEDIVGRLNSALRQHSGNNTREETRQEKP